MSANWGSAEAISLSHYIRILNARKALVFAILFLVVITAALFTFFSPKWYRATTTVKVEKPEEHVALFQAKSNAYYDPFFTQESLEIIKSKKILFQVIEHEELDLRKQLGDAFAEGEELTLNQAYQILAYQMLEVENAKQGTALIDIHVWAKENPQLAADIANAIAIIYSRDRIAFAVSNQTEGIERLEKELVEQESRVRSQRDTVEGLRKEFKISGIDLNVEMLAQEIENLRTLEKTLITMRVEAIGRKTKWDNFKQIPVEKRLSLVNSELITDPNIQNLLQAFMIAQQQHVRIESQLGDEHPELKSSRDNLKTIKTQLDSLLDGYEKALEISYNESQAQVTELEEQLSEARIDQILSAQSKMRPFEEAVEKLREEEQIYQTLKLTLRQRQIDFQVPKKSIEILNPAEPSSIAGRPNWTLNLLLAFIVGTSMGVGIALLIEYFDSSFRSVEDMERVLELPILGVVTKKTGLVSAAGYSSNTAEAYRVIQTNVELACSGDSLKTLAVQSAGPGEGKSTTLHNIATVMAMSGQKVLIIDTDLRRPTQHQILKIDKAPGFIDTLRGDLQIEECIRPSGVEGLDVLTCGRGNFALNVLHIKKIKSIIEDLSSKYDKILFDPPPVIGVSDASVMATLVDGVILVVQHRRNPQSMTRRAKEIIEKGDGKLLGLVLNQVPSSGVADYNYYTSNYAYYGTKSEGERPEKIVSSGFEDEKERFQIEE